MALDPKAQAALALHRFGLGPRAGSIASMASDPRGALLAELDRVGAGRINNPDLLTSGAAGGARQCAEWRGRGGDEGSVRAPGTSSKAESGARRAAADLSRRSQGPHRCRAGR